MEGTPEWGKQVWETISKDIKETQSPKIIQVYKALKSSFVTQPKLALLAARQADKAGDKFLGQGIMTLIGQLAD